MMTGVMHQIMVAVVVVMLMMVRTARSHGRMLDPAQRSSLWRFGVEGAETNYNDNGLFCGGFAKQYGPNKGKCGICGDDYSSPHPRPNEAGGQFGKGIIAKTYQQGQVIDVRVEITANHMGYFIFKLCPNNDVTREVTQKCLDSHVLKVIKDGRVNGTRFYIDSSRGMKYVKLQLPADITCSQCVLQWKYNTGNSWGCDNTCCCIGCGNQENFINCADVAIRSSAPGEAQRTTRSPSPATTPQTQPTTRQQERTTTTPQTQPTTRQQEGTTTTPQTQPTTRQQERTTTTPQTQPTTRQQERTTTTKERQGGNCRAVGVWLILPGMGAWCQANCIYNFCPPSHCTCS